MKKAKLEKKKEENQKEIEIQYSIKSMIKIVIALILIFVLFYVLTVFVIDNKKVEEDVKNHAVIDSEKITLSQILSQKENEYYVLATKESMYKKAAGMKANYIELYDSYILKYQQSEDEPLKFYRVDLDSAFNKSYLSDKSNITDNLSELKISDEVLIKIKNKKIDKYYIGHSLIASELSKL